MREAVFASLPQLVVGVRPRGGVLSPTVSAPMKGDPSRILLTSGSIQPLTVDPGLLSYFAVQFSNVLVPW